MAASVYFYVVYKIYSVFVICPVLHVCAVLSRVRPPSSICTEFVFVRRTVSNVFTIRVTHTNPSTVSHTITAIFHPTQCNPSTLSTYSTNIHRNHMHQRVGIFSASVELAREYENFSKIAEKYAFLYEPAIENCFEMYKSPALLVFNVWMIHKIEIFPHYTYPLTTDKSTPADDTHKVVGACAVENVVRADEVDAQAVDASPTKYPDISSHSQPTRPSSSPPAKNSYVHSTQPPYRTCSHYGFNYPITYQPHITIHPAHLLTAVQLQREKVIAFIKSTALSLNTGYFQQRNEPITITTQTQTQLQPRAPRLKCSEALAAANNNERGKEKTQQQQQLNTTTTTTVDDCNNNIDTNGSYISVKEIKLEPTKRRQRNSKAQPERVCCESVTGVTAPELSEYERDTNTYTSQLNDTHQQEQQHQLDSLSEHFSSLLSIGGTSYQPGSHSHTADFAPDHEELDEEHDAQEPQQHYDVDSGDNYSTIFAPTTERASYVLRDFLPAHAQVLDEMPEHKPESEQHDATQHTENNKFVTSTQVKARKLRSGAGVDEESDDAQMYAHHSHKQIKLTLNSHAHSTAARRIAQEDAAINVALPHERYRQVTASLSEAGSSSAASSLRSLEIHININVKNSDCARTLQTHEAEFRRKLERIVNEEINLIAQQLSVSAQQHQQPQQQQQEEYDSKHVGNIRGLHMMESTEGGLLKMAHASTRHLLHQSAHTETLSDLRLAGTLAAGQRSKSRAKSTKLGRTASAQKHKEPTASPPSCCAGVDASSRADDGEHLSQPHRRLIAMLEHELESLLNGIICANALHNHAVMCDCKMKVAQISEELRASLSTPN